ncbi:MAG: VWA domain-containing protein [Fuerstiella sp.]|nr:VWA domain-containing protein [Fuerstiella sp.]
MKQTNPINRRPVKIQKRRGVFFALAIVCLVAAMTFVGMSVDLGMITVTKTRMQAAADSAALAAAQEIVVAVRDAGEAGETDVQMIQAIAAADARTMAEHICDLNEFYIDPAVDVLLGSRLLAEDGVSYVETWGSPPYNMVKVIIRKTNPDEAAPDAKLPLSFAPIQGDRSQSLTATATAFIESRDIVSVLDYSGSMAYDSLIDSVTIDRMSLSQVESSLDDIWDALAASTVGFSNDSSTMKFPPGGLGEINSYEGTYIGSNSINTVFDALDLGGDSEGVRFYNKNNYKKFMTELGPGTYNLNTMSGNLDDKINSFRVPDGYTVTLWDFENEGGWQYGPVSSDVSSMGSGYNNDAEWIVITNPAGSDGYVPFPQEGKTSSGGTRKGKPSKNSSETMWKDYIQFVKTDSALNSYGYRKKYGYRTLMHYLISEHMMNHESEDLWRAPIYPHHAVKEGMSMFTEFLDNLGYGDNIGLITYATTSMRQTGLWDDGADVTVDLNGKHLTDDYDAIDTIQKHKQPGHYNRATGIGYGLEDALELIEEQGRYGAKKSILLMTDGQSNQYPSGFGEGDLPAGWNWNEITDFDGDGVADFEIDNSYGGWDSNWRAALYAFMIAKQASDADIMVHTISVGSGADTDLMGAIASMTGGTHLWVPGGSTITEMEEDLQTAFAILAGQVPPARLVADGN